ncbi:response regulator transcription factor [Dactylosporangium sp. NPDC000555]|uniref:response regulator transcription factor n=1 Tax=Dactylosporangium sp. NPDC000555 TaxID=3154260 RepID=UPI003329FE3E
MKTASPGWASTPSRPEITVVLADDQDLVRTSMRLMLETERDLRVVGEAADGEEAVTLTRQLRPDVVIMDVRMPRVDGIEATRQLSGDVSPPAILILTTFDTDEFLFGALHAGASGFVLKHDTVQAFIEAVRAVARGDGFVSPGPTARLIRASRERQPPSRPSTSIHLLTPREYDVLALLGLGLTNNQIGRCLAIESSTAKTHVQRILAKLNVGTRVQAALIAHEFGLTRPPQRTSSEASTSPEHHRPPARGPRLPPAREDESVRRR